MAIAIFLIVVLLSGFFAMMLATAILSLILHAVVAAPHDWKPYFMKARTLETDRTEAI